MSIIPSGFIGHVVDFWPILDDARRLGVPVNQNAINELKSTLEDVIVDINKQIQELVPEILKNLAPRRKTPTEIEYGYKRPPTKLINENYNRYLTISKEWNARNYFETWYFDTFDEYLSRNPIIKFDKKTEKEKSRQTLVSFAHKMEDGSYISKWYLRSDFKPSKEQLVKYINWKQTKLSFSIDKEEKKLAKYYKVPTRLDIKTRELKPTTGKRALQDLLDSTGDELLRLVIGDKDYEDGSLGERAGIRSIKKVIDNDIPRWQPANDGSVHTTWGIKAASGQLDARNPNILNASKHTVVGKLFRQVISCGNEEILVECDKKSYHVALMGYCANDSNYIRFSQIDPHSYFTAYVANGVLGLPTMDMSNSEIKEICNRYKNDTKWGWVRQHISKIIVLGNQLGLGAKKIFINQNDAVTDLITKTRIKPFKAIDSIKKLQLMIGGMFPAVEKFKKEIRRIASNQHFLKNDWGYSQKFWEVFTMKWVEEDSAWYQIPGTESEKAIAFLVQSNAFGDIRDKLIQLRDKGLLEKYPFVSSIHDSFVFRILKKWLDNFLVDVYPILISPSRKLIKSCCIDGLIVGVDVSWGRNFANYHEVKNRDGMREIKI